MDTRKLIFFNAELTAVLAMAWKLGACNVHDKASHLLIYPLDPKP